MAKKITPQEGQLVLQLYDLRREAEMRKARSWYAGEFWPQNADEFLKVANAFPGQENAWMRQVNGYWDMATALVLHGAIDEHLFIQGGISGEMFFVFAKFYPFLKEIRQKMDNPDAFANIEQVATGSKLARKRLERFLKNVEARRKSMAKSAKA